MSLFCYHWHRNNSFCQLYLLLFILFNYKGSTLHPYLKFDPNQSSNIEIGTFSERNTYVVIVIIVVFVIIVTIVIIVIIMIIVILMIILIDQINPDMVEDNTEYTFCRKRHYQNEDYWNAKNCNSVDLFYRQNKTQIKCKVSSITFFLPPNGY